MKSIIPAFILVLAVASASFGQITQGMEYLNGVGSIGKQDLWFYFMLAGVTFFSFFIVLIRPNIGIVVAMILFPFVTQSEVMTLPKVFASIVLVGFFAAWLTGKIGAARNIGEATDYLGCERAFIVFLIYLAVNGVYGVLFNKITPLDVVRDLIPIFSFVIFLIAKQFVTKEKGVDFIERVTFGLLVFLGLNVVLISAFHIFSMFAIVPAVASTLQMQGLFFISILGLMYFNHSRLVLLSTAFITIIYLVTIDNRTQFIAGLFCVALLFLITRMTKMKLTIFLGSLLCLLVIFIAAERFAPEAMARKTAKFNELSDAQGDLSIMDRKGEAGQCFQLFLKHPVLGMGAGYIYHMYRENVVGLLQKDYWDTNFTHADIMFFLSKLGLVGTFLFLWFYFRVVQLSWMTWKKAITKDARTKGLICFAILIDALIIGQSTPVLQTRGDAFFLALTMGYVYCLYNVYVAKPEREREEIAEAELFYRENAGALWR
jgi:hypothetical protein